MRRIAIIGVGLLGTAVAERLLEGRFEVSGYDPRADTLDALRPRGLKAAASAAEAARGADAVFTILPSLAAVEAVIRGPNGLLDAISPSTILIQMSTISPSLTRELAAAASARGVAFLDAPMSGTSAMVARGDCTIFVGGDPATVDACRPAFDAIARMTIRIGDVGQASLAKLATNLLVGLHTAALAEALVLGAKGGLRPATLLDVLKQSAAASRMVDVRGPLMVDRHFEPQMKIDLFLKDFTLMLDEGRRLGVPLPLTSLARELAAATAGRGRGGDDLAAVITTLETMAGLEG
jgi:3-hydroxyisobutyrate dehydrogenase-like beta-hydroxyacid dehydrogenase